MSYSAQSHVNFGDSWTAGLHNQLIDNVAYLKSMTDQIFLTVYNNYGSAITAGQQVSLDPTYTSGLGVTLSSTAGDQRGFGVVVTASIASHATGLIYAPGFILGTINVTGAVAFGHSLITSGTPGYAMDSGGGVLSYGAIGWALGTQASGNGTINALLRSNPLYFTAAQVITQKYGGNDLATGTLCASVVNVTPNQLLLFGGFNYTGTHTVPLWNAQTPAVLQAYSAGSVAYLGALLGAGAATANYTGAFSSSTGVAVVVALNGINQGGGAATFGAVAHNNYSAAGAISITVACSPGDMVICTVLISGGGSTPGLSAENQTVVEKSMGAGTGYEVMVAIATGGSVTFNATFAGSGANLRCSMDGLALHTA